MSETDRLRDDYLRSVRPPPSATGAFIEKSVVGIGMLVVMVPMLALLFLILWLGVQFIKFLWFL
jgi:hypothetical protein